MLINSRLNPQTSVFGSCFDLWTRVLKDLTLSLCQALLSLCGEKNIMQEEEGGGRERDFIFLFYLFVYFKFIFTIYFSMIFYFKKTPKNLEKSEIL